MTGWILAYVLSAAIAAGSSSANLARGCSEMNPLAPQSAAWNAVYKGGLTAGFSVTIHLGGKVSPALGKGIALAGMAVNAVDTTHNLRTHCGARR